MTVHRLLDEISTDELVEWMAYDRIEPFGYHMENFRMGVVSATVANVAPRGRGSRALKPSDFYPAQAKTTKLTPRQQRELAERRARKGKS